MLPLVKLVRGIVYRTSFLTVTSEMLSNLDSDMHRVVEPGEPTIARRR
jgi:hypothetical protein